MRRFFNRLSKTLLVFALSVGALRADERPSPFATPASTAAVVSTPAEKPMRAEDANVKELLDRVGYPYTVSDTTAGTKAFWITGSRGDLDFKIRVAVSPNGAMVWLNTVVSEVKDAESVAGRHYLALLEENQRINPAMFTYSGKDKYIRLLQCFAYNMISAQYLREEIDIHLETLHTTRKLWDSANWSKAEVTRTSFDEQPVAAKSEGQSASAVYHKYAKLSDGITASNQEYVNEVARFVNSDDFNVIAMRTAFNNVVLSHKQALAELDSLAGGEYAGVNDFVAAARSYVATDLEQAERWVPAMLEIIEKADADRIFSSNPDLASARAELIELIKAMGAENGFAVEFEKTLSNFVIRYGLNDQTA